MPAGILRGAAPKPVGLGERLTRTARKQAPLQSVSDKFVMNPPPEFVNSSSKRRLFDALHGHFSS